MENPLISIIVPVYQAEAYLDECVQSMINQTYQNLEIILVDDGSKDQSPTICDAWAKKDSRIKVIHKPNGGASSARNAGLDVASGDYIGFVDSDDIIAADMYEILLNALESSNVGIAACSPQIMSEDGRLLEKRSIPAKREMDAQQALESIFLLQTDVAMWCKLYAREIFAELRFPEGEINEEFPLIIPTIMKSGGMVHVQKWLYFYRARIGSVTKQRRPSERHSDIVYKNIHRIEAQLQEYGLGGCRSFGFFAAQYSYFRSLNYEKNFELLTEKLRRDYRVYRGIMWKNIGAYLCSRYSAPKDKVLYLLVLTKMLRPMYKLFRPGYV